MYILMKRNCRDFMEIILIRRRNIEITGIYANNEITCMFSCCIGNIVHSIRKDIGSGFRYKRAIRKIYKNDRL